MKISADCQIERAVSADMTRQHIAHAYLDVAGKRLMACDGHVGVILPVEVDEGDVSGRVTADALKAARKVVGKRGTSSIHCNGSLAVEGGPTFERPKEENCGEFPPMDQVMPQFKQGDEGTVTVGLNPTLLLDLAKAMGATDKNGNAVVNLTFKLPTFAKEGVSRKDMLDAILVNGGADTHTDAIGVIMPCRIR